MQGLPVNEAAVWRDEYAASRAWTDRDEIIATGVETNYTMLYLLWALLFKAHFGRNAPTSEPFRIMHPDRPSVDPEPPADGHQKVDPGAVASAFDRMRP